MIQLKTAKRMRNVIDKARMVKPRVSVNHFGSYTVTSKKMGASYTVTCERRAGAGLRLAHCTCIAGELGRACHHVAAAVAWHIVLAAERAVLN
jgi:hypothetical protein